METLRQALEHLRGGRGVALVSVIHSSGSTPRHAGARMAVCESGETMGTIGGGRVELEATLAATAVAGGASAIRVRHHLVRDLAMCCGGTMELYIEPIAPSASELARALERVERREPTWLVHDLAGGAITTRPVDSDDVATAAPHLEGQSQYLAPLRPRDRAILFGLGHVSRALGPILCAIDFEVVVCDDNETDALERVPPWAHHHVASFELADIERALGPLGAGDALLIMTRDHALDQRLLEQALLLPALDKLSYLGLIGSLGKVGRFRKRLFAKGIATEERWQQLRAPIGLHLGAETPAEIAISVAAELVARRRGVTVAAPLPAR